MNYLICINITGLILDILGVIIITKPILIHFSAKNNADKLTKDNYPGFPSLISEENLKTDYLKKKIKDSKKAMLGLYLIVSGFTLQIIANVLEYISLDKI